MRSLKADSADRVLADDGPSKKKGKQKKAPTERAMPKRNRRRKLAMAGAAVVMTAFLGTTAWGLSGLASGCRKCSRQGPGRVASRGRTGGQRSDRFWP